MNILLPILSTISLIIFCGVIEHLYEGVGILLALLLTWPNAILWAVVLSKQ